MTDTAGPDDIVLVMPWGGGDPRPWRRSGCNGHATGGQEAARSAEPGAAPRRAIMIGAAGGRATGSGGRFLGAGRPVAPAPPPSHGLGPDPAPERVFRPGTWVHPEGSDAPSRRGGWRRWNHPPWNDTLAPVGHPWHSLTELLLTPGEVADGRLREAWEETAGRLGLIRLGWLPGGGVADGGGELLVHPTLRAIARWRHAAAPGGSPGLGRGSGGPDGRPGLRRSPHRRGPTRPPPGPPHPRGGRGPRGSAPGSAAGSGGPRARPRTRPWGKTRARRRP